jgi:hypothetical protein
MTPDRYSSEYRLRGDMDAGAAGFVTCFECGAVVQADHHWRHDQWHEFLDRVLGVIRP